MKFKFFIVLIFISTVNFSFAQQLQLEKYPEKNQLFPRDKNDMAFVVFSGFIIDEADFNELKLKKFKDRDFLAEQIHEITIGTFTIF
jgi:hypothetical protein